MIKVICSAWLGAARASDKSAIYQLGVGLSKTTYPYNGDHVTATTLLASGEETGQNKQWQAAPHWGAAPPMAKYGGKPVA
jgi:hypothetical protein